LLRELNTSGIKLAIASNKYHEATVELVEKYFPEINWKVVFGHRANRPKKPDPSIVYDILEIAKTSKDKTLYIGDSSVDMKTASNAGVKSIGVTWGFRKEEELRTHHADFIVHHPREILELI
jgi:phosphoglycolate phosphatase